MDLPFLLLTLLLTAIGLIMLFSASFPFAAYEDGDPTYYLKRQGIFAALGIAAMFVVSKINYQRWRGASRILMYTAFLLLILVIIPHNPIALTRNNATRWLGVGGFSFQPSEIAKLAVIVLFADSISKKRDKMRTLRYGILPYVGVLGVLSVLMLLEPHLSGTILIVGTGAVMMIVGGIPGWLVGTGIGGAGVAGVLFVKLAESGVIEYGSNRIAMWKDPWIDPLDEGFQMCQSLIAIGSGGLLGVGLGKSRQKFLYLPERHNDFIFSVVCEEMGLIGACLIMLLFALLILRGFWIALRARDRFGTLLVVGVTTHLGLQTFLNIAVVSGLVPATGISLPFFSYGGTALTLQLVEMGIVLSVSRQIPAPRAG
ncbi:MAG: putative lipid II flippase FtsW [Clostridiales bacterium]|nr:putative lipid II flippase FtsW [Candidatus Cacconaster stercorequi]